MFLKLNDGGQFEGKTPDEIVQKIWASSKFDDSKTVDEYMKRFSQRINLYNGETLDTQSCEAFLNSIVKAKVGELKD